MDRDLNIPRDSLTQCISDEISLLFGFFHLFYDIRNKVKLLLLSLTLCESFTPVEA